MDQTLLCFKQKIFRFANCTVEVLDLKTEEKINLTTIFLISQDVKYSYIHPLTKQNIVIVYVAVSIHFITDHN